MDDAAISRKKPPLGNCDDVAHGRDAVLERHGFKTAVGVQRGGLINSKGPPEREVEAVTACQRVFALCQGVDPVERQAIRAAPDYDVAME